MKALSGLWHGASWNFVIWGTLHALYMIIANITTRQRMAASNALQLQRFPHVVKLLQVAGTFGRVCFAWIFFRARTTADALLIVSHLPTG